MLRRNLLIGGLVAGAFVLPSLASAGVVKGVCSNCHTMHASQDGVSSGTSRPDLLKANGCVACHIEAGVDNDAGLTGVPTAGLIKAPQVDGSAAVPINIAGYFTAAGEETQHNVSGFAVTDTKFAGKNIPGSTTAYANNKVTCEACHTKAGHHNPAGYRMLATKAGSTANTTYGAVAAGTFPADRSVISYKAVNMNNVCAACHPNFHDAAGTGVSPNFVRHPVNINLVGHTRTGIDTTPAATDAVVLGHTNFGDADTTSAIVMCLSCHVAHGGPNNDLLAFSYQADTNAGNNAQGLEGCEVCHSYGTAGM